MANRRLGFMIALLVFGPDQLAKWIFTGPLHVQDLEHFYLLPFFQFTYTQNIGISLGLLNATTEVGRWMLAARTSAIALGVTFWIGSERNCPAQIALRM